MLTQSTTVCFRGIQAIEICVETQISGGSLPSFSIVGLPDKAISESRERVRSALFTLGLALPAKRVLINLSPANIQKEGSHYDLPIIIGLLMAQEILPQEALSQYISLGEVGLDGSIKPVYGVLSAAFFAAEVNRPLICPAACGGEAVWGGSIPILAPESIVQLINHFKQTQVLPRPTGEVEEEITSTHDFGHIKGQVSVKRALILAAAGGHNVLMSGPPGSGKSMMAACMPSILPPLSAQEALDLTMIHGMVHPDAKKKLLRHRPFRSPHHSASMVSLVGGGGRALPGEISLAHTGILFLDELPEFSRSALESLRQSMETRQAVVARANHHVTYPADFQLIAAMNPCRCGYLGNLEKQCGKAPICGAAYRQNLSGPLLDRIDLFIDVKAVRHAQWTSADAHLSSQTMASVVIKARQKQMDRQKVLNAKANNNILDEQIAQSDPQVRDILAKAADRFGLSMRGYYRLIRLARTIADVGASDQIDSTHIQEALSYRS